jgi:serine/threonine-protein kinase
LLDGPIQPRVNLPAELLRLGYTLLCRLGEGATSEVFEARHMATGRRVAIKVSRADVPEAQAIIARMQTEWNVGRGLRHPHLVTILDGGTFSDGRAWLVMERLVGHDLLQEMEQHGALAPLRAIHIVRQVCEALQVLHRRGAVHRDVKPENVFLSAEGRVPDHVKLIDLGIVSLPEDAPERAHEPTGSFIMGTPLYLAPEQARGLPPDPRTDLYAVGGVLFHMLSGVPPFDGSDPTEIVAKHVNAEVEPLTDFVPDLPAGLVALVHGCLQKERDDRPGSAAEVIAALDACARDMVGDFAPLPSLRRAPVPEVPPAGHPPGWLRFAEHLEHVSGAYWKGDPRRAPPTVQVELRAVAAARSALETARAEADARREAADVAARFRIEQRERLQRRARRTAAALERARVQFRDATRAAGETAVVLDQIDDAYEREVEALRAVAAETAPEVSLVALEARQRAVEALLRKRAKRLEALAAARAEERAAAEKLAVLRAEEADVQREYADQELEAQDDGWRHEQQAGDAADAALTAMRGLEQACLRLLVEYVRAVQRD